MNDPHYGAWDRGWQNFKVFSPQNENSTMLGSFVSLAKYYLKISVSRRRRGLFWPHSQGFQSVIIWLHCFWTWGEIEHHIGTEWKSIAAHLMTVRSREWGQNPNTKGLGTRYPWKTCPSDLLPATGPHLLIAPIQLWSYQCINPLMKLAP